MPDRPTAPDEECMGCAFSYYRDAVFAESLDCAKGHELWTPDCPDWRVEDWEPETDEV